MVADEHSIETTWALMGLSSKLAQSVSNFSPPIMSGRYADPTRLQIGLRTCLLFSCDNNISQCALRSRQRPVEAICVGSAEASLPLLGAIYHRLLAGMERSTSPSHPPLSHCMIGISHRKAPHLYPSIRRHRAPCRPGSDTRGRRHATI